MAHRDKSASTIPEPLSEQAAHVACEALRNCVLGSDDLQGLVKEIQRESSFRALTTREQLLQVTEQTSEALSQSSRKEGDRDKALLSDLVDALHKYPSQGPSAVLTSIQAQEVIYHQAISNRTAEAYKDSLRNEAELFRRCEDQLAVFTEALREAQRYGCSTNEQRQVLQDVIDHLSVEENSCDSFFGTKPADPAETSAAGQDKALSPPSLPVADLDSHGAAGSQDNQPVSDSESAQ